MSSPKSGILAKAVFASLAVLAANAQFTPAPGSPLAVASAPRSVVTGDFNGDGKTDVATANFNGNSVTVLLGNGAGGFAAAPGSPFTVGTNPQGVAIGDFNGDGKPDLAAVNFSDNTVTILLGNGTGRFTLAPGGPIPVGSSPIFVAVGDFNGDGNADIVTANSSDNTVTVLLGNGLGGFTTAAGGNVPVGTVPRSIAIGDLNGDGKQDLVTANSGSNNVTVLLGNGSGGFAVAPAAAVRVGSSPFFVALADLNGDGKLDLITANSGDNTISEFSGDGTGGFAAAAGSPFTVGATPYAVAVADFNGDGNQDIATANYNGNNVTFLAGDGTGAFTEATGSPFGAGAAPFTLATGDFNGDGKPDLAIANLSGGTVTVLLNSLPAITVNLSAIAFYAAVGHAAPASIPVSVSAPAAGSTYTVSSNRPWLTPLPTSHGTGGVTPVQLSANATSLGAGVYTGIVRFTAPNMFEGATAVTLNVAGPSGALQAAASPFTVGPGPQAIAAGDFNGDGVADLATANYSGNNVTVLLSDRAGGFTAVGPFAVGVNPAAVAVGDFNADGKADIVTANSGSNNTTLLLGNGRGGFTQAPGSPFATGGEPLSVAVADFNGDGKPDIVTANNLDQDVTVLLGNGTGGFTAPPGSPFLVGPFPRSVAVADFNADGKPDLVTVNSGNYVTVLLGNGAGAFATAGISPVGSFPQAVAVGDLNGDGRPDMVVANSGSNNVTVLLGNGAGTFTAAAGSPVAVGLSPQAIAMADVNGDGKPDVIAANVGDNTVTVLLGNGAGGFIVAPGSPFPAGATPLSLAAGDFNGDGKTDIAAANAGGSTVTVLLGSTAITSSALTTTAGTTIAHGTSVPLTMVVAQPSGGFNVPSGTGTFLDGGTVIGAAPQTASPYTFTATGLAAGSHMFTALYGGDFANALSTAGPILITVMPQNQTITFGALLNKAFSGTSFTVAATASSGLAVAFASTTSAVCTVTGAAVTLVSVGTCTIQASQAGSTDFNAAAPVSQSFHVTQAAQTITFAALSNVMVGSTPFSVDATASSGLAVSFASTTGPVCTVSGVTVTIAATGTCTIRASQAGNLNYGPAVPVAQNFSVTPSGQTITFAALSSQTFGTTPFSVAASASSGLAVTLASTTASVCTVSGTTVTLISAGTCGIRASQSGNSSFAAAATVSQTFTVMPAGQTITFAALQGKTYGAVAFTVSAMATSALAVSFTSITPQICTVTAASVTLAGVGTCTIEASQAGNANYIAAPVADQSFTVTQATQTITFAPLQDKAFGSAPFTVSATASSGLTVSFIAANSAICTVSGATVTLLTGGMCIIQALQNGTVNVAAATPVNQSFQVTPGSQTITFGAIPNMSFGAPPFPVNATASSGQIVSFTSTPLSVCTVAGDTVTILSAGVCTLQASQPGDMNHAAAPPISQHFTVNKATQTISFGTLTNLPLGTVPFPVSATAASGLTVTFTSTTLPVCTVAAATVTLVSMGGCTIKASQPGDTNYLAATAVSQSFTVGMGPVAISSVLNAASYSTIQIAPGSYAAAFGANFSTTTAQAKSLPLPSTLAGAMLTVTDSGGATQTAQLFYVSPTQINFLMPEGLAKGAANVTVTTSAGSASFPATVDQVSPSLFTADSTGKGAPAALALAYGATGAPVALPVFNCSGAPLACTQTPINLGTASTNVFLELFGTGIKGRSDLALVSVTVGGVALKVTYAGVQGTFAGLDQINVLLDRSLIGKGSVPLQLIVDGILANPVVVNIK